MNGFCQNKTHDHRQVDETAVGDICVFTLPNEQSLQICTDEECATANYRIRFCCTECVKVTLSVLFVVEYSCIFCDPIITVRSIFICVYALTEFNI